MSACLRPRFFWTPTPPSPPKGGLALYITDLGTKNVELPLELQGSATTHSVGFVELSSLPIYLEDFTLAKWSNWH